MTSGREAHMLSPERVRWFADYYRQNQTWGVFRAALHDGHFHIGPVNTRQQWPADLRDAADWFDLLTSAQRARLGMRAVDLANTSTPGPVK